MEKSGEYYVLRIFIDNSWQGLNIGTMALDETINFLRKNITDNNVYAYAHVENIVSQKFLTKYGFTFFTKDKMKDEDVILFRYELHKKQ